MSILTAFGFTQFAEFLDPKKINRERKLKVSRLEPFAARLDLEVIKTPHPVNPKTREYEKGDGKGETTYLHFMLNQRTLPHPECEERVDGWCELGTFLEKMEGKTEDARFDKACFGEWEGREYGGFMDGSPGAD